jgi:hypothetical protein
VIAPPERIALLHGESRDDPGAFEPVLTFAPDGATTRIVMRTVFPTKELRDERSRSTRRSRAASSPLSCLAAGVEQLLAHRSYLAAHTENLAEASTSRQPPPARRWGGVLPIGV